MPLQGIYNPFIVPYLKQNNHIPFRELVDLHTIVLKCRISVCIRETLNTADNLQTQPYIAFFERMGTGFLELDGIWRKFFLQASRSFLYSLGTLETPRNPQKPTFYFL